MHRNIVVVLMALATGSGVVCAQQLSDTRTEWKVGVAEFSGEHLSRENGYLLSSLPLQLLDTIEKVVTHTIGDVEREQRARSLIQTRLVSKRGELASLYTTYNKLFLMSGAESKQRQNTFQRISEVTSAIELLESADPGKVSIPLSKPVVFVQGKVGQLLPPVQTAAARIARENDLDILVYGHIEEISDYLFVDVYVFASTGEETTFLQTVGSREVLRMRIKEVGESVISLLYGAPWGTLVIRSSNPASRIRLDDEYLGAGSTTLQPVPVGEHTLLVRTAGFADAAYRVVVEAGRSVEVDAVPGPARGGVVRIDSFPSGADVYVGSVWRGVTPCTVPVPLEATQLRLEAPGYGAYERTIVPGKTLSVSIMLVPDVIDEAEIVHSRRGVFYQSLGWFALAVPAPLFLLDLTNQLTGEANRQASRSVSFQSLSEERQIALSGYVAGAFLAGVLFVNLVIDLLDYIDLVGINSG